MSRGHGFVTDSVSCVIVCYNRIDLTERCLASIRDSDDLPDELVLVDNASTDATTHYGWKRDQDTGAFINEWCGMPMQVAHLTQNVGWGRGANIGSQLAEGEYLLHLNNDTEVQPGWLTSLVEAMEDDTAVVAGTLRNPDGSIQHAGIRTFHDSNGTFTAENITTEQAAGAPDCVSLAAALCRADAWNELGGVDPRFRNGYEDVDYCLRAKRAGWRLKYVPESVVMHHAHASGPERWTHVHDNIALLNERWG